MRRVPWGRNREEDLAQHREQCADQREHRQHEEHGHGPRQVQRYKRIEEGDRDGQADEQAAGHAPESYNFWDFGTNAITPVAMGIPTIGFGPGAYKLAHMRDEHCSTDEIIQACDVYKNLIDILK